MNNDKKYFIILGIVLCLIAATYYWDNRYVELRPVLRKEYTRHIISYQNDFYRIAERNETPPNFYKNIKFVLDHEFVDYIMKNGVIYIKYKYMNDLEMIWNHTLKTNDADWLKNKRKEDSMKILKENSRIYNQQLENES